LWPQNPRLWDTIKRPKWQIHSVEKGTKIQTEGIENLFNEMIAENSQNLGKEIDIQVCEICRSPNIHDQKRTFSCNILVKMPRA
jgi:hypothetical protein